eukprot:CAMPEP_0204245512 /NCGR_PEP_ID=MMETSP0361-20130328/97671_1 /ASSEMBLY_ACC=CAM_ASM_000343 /TAXON_ID=268821 /ORGANISM="Scrippsiella Hangoei, Strain SHTV-5" /LENGTH=711 /DNA_ID=CAMNT_0051218717 /DNA_START=27 /DNA_END=2162 /DNA_ORIENTATION=+
MKSAALAPSSSQAPNQAADADLVQSIAISDTAKRRSVYSEARKRLGSMARLGRISKWQALQVVVQASGSVTKRQSFVEAMYDKHTEAEKERLEEACRPPSSCADSDSGLDDDDAEEQLRHQVEELQEAMAADASEVLSVLAGFAARVCTYESGTAGCSPEQVAQKARDMLELLTGGGIVAGLESFRDKYSGYLEELDRLQEVMRNNADQAAELAAWIQQMSRFSRVVLPPGAAAIELPFAGLATSALASLETELADEGTKCDLKLGTGEPAQRLESSAPLVPGDPEVVGASPSCTKAPIAAHAQLPSGDPEIVGASPSCTKAPIAAHARLPSPENGAEDVTEIIPRDPGISRAPGISRYRVYPDISVPIAAVDPELLCESTVERGPSGVASNAKSSGKFDLDVLGVHGQGHFRPRQGQPRPEPELQAVWQAASVPPDLASPRASDVSSPRANRTLQSPVFEGHHQDASVKSPARRQNALFPADWDVGMMVWLSDVEGSGAGRSCASRCREPTRKRCREPTCKHESAVASVQAESPGRLGEVPGAPPERALPGGRRLIWRGGPAPRDLGGSPRGASKVGLRLAPVGVLSSFSAADPALSEPQSALPIRWLANDRAKQHAAAEHYCAERGAKQRRTAEHSLNASQAEEGRSVGCRAMWTECSCVATSLLSRGLALSYMSACRRLKGSCVVCARCRCAHGMLNQRAKTPPERNR